jgi:zinc transport system permease protein
MLEIFQYKFMIRAFLAGMVIAVIAPLIGAFLVVRRYSILADTLAHVSLAGVAVGMLTKTHPVAAAVFLSALSAFGIERLRESKKVYGESALALFLWGSLAVAVVVISLAGGFNVGLFGFLFGSIATVAPVDLYFVAGLGALVLLLVLSFYKELFFVSFDEELAKVNGINARAINIVIIMLAAVTVSLSMRIVGVLLIGALMVIPVITAMQLSRGFRQTLIISVIISLASVVSGLFLSYYLNLASGGTIVLITLAFFILSLLFDRND